MVCLVSTVFPFLVLAQEAKPVKEATPAPTPAAQTPAPAPSQAPTPAPAKLKLLNMRFDEDYSYLDGAEGSYEEDFFDPIKNIHLDDDWRLTLGGEVRFRMEAETNRAFGATEPAQDTFTLYRYMVHADLKYKKTFRIFAQGIAAFDEDRDLPLRPTDEDRWDIQQLFADWRFLGEDHPLTLRVGRQELEYGNSRLVAAPDWGNIRRRFDAVKLFAKTEKWDVDAWFSSPVNVQRKQRDRNDEDLHFYGGYVTYKGIERHGIDGFLFAVDDSGDRVNPNGNAGDISTYTLGSRFWGKTAAWDYEAELAGQWGHWAGDVVHAYSWSMDGGYTVDSCTYKPRFGAGFDWAGGDKNPRDGEIETFDQLFPSGHKYFGFLDLIGRRNVTATNFNLTFWPLPKKVKGALAYHTFWLTADRDALYNAAGGAGRRDLTGRSGKEVGHELDLTLSWNLDAHSSILLGYSHFWDSDFIQQSGVSEDADLVYVQYAMKF
jgi:hypothetical protein